jgi:transcriptional regulator with XRE-family HTH domain
MNLIGGALIKIARLRAGLTQRELGERLGLPQSSIARWESGARQPAIDNLVEAVRACGLDPVVSLNPTDRSNDGFIQALLQEVPAERLRVQVAAANGMRPLERAAAARRAGGAAVRGEEFDPLAIMRALKARDVRYVLVGRLAENIRAAPLVPTGAEVALCAQTSDCNTAALDQALRDLGATRWRESDEHPFEIPLELRGIASARRWWVESAGGAVAVVAVPHGTTGYGDVARHATDEDLDSGLSVSVAALTDLIRMADAAVDPADRGGLPTLRRAYELATRDERLGQLPVSVPAGLEELFAEHGIVSA